MCHTAFRYYFSNKENQSWLDVNFKMCIWPRSFLVHLCSYWVFKSWIFNILWINIVFLLYNHLPIIILRESLGLCLLRWFKIMLCTSADSIAQINERGKQNLLKTSQRMANLRLMICGFLFHSSNFNISKRINWTFTYCYPCFLFTHEVDYCGYLAWFNC